ncbi:MAG: alpha-glucan family phosphorylase [Actinomycetota bacterium]
MSDASRLPDIPVVPPDELPVPLSFARLYDLAYNLWWSWDPAGRELWAAIDPMSWGRYHNPLPTLHRMNPAAWPSLEASTLFHDRYTDVVRRFDAYMDHRPTWYSRRGSPLSGPVAYLCAEFGVHESLPIYSGGLGILAGDHAKAASDLGIPLVGVGLLYRRGYFNQEIDADGDQQHFYPTLDIRRLPLRRVAGPVGGQLKVDVEFPGRVVRVAVWKLDVGRVPLLLLDTDIPENSPADRPITHTLYVSGRDMRFCQELVLGVGGVRALAALGIAPAVWHVNEGHAAMSLLERLALSIGRGRSREAAIEEVRGSTVFTLHTPVPAGNEVFEADLARKYLGPWAMRIGGGIDGVRALAQARDGDDRFDLGALAIRLSRGVNGVSKRHAEVVSEDWAHLLAGGAARAVTNGVHTPTWVGRSTGRILAGSIGRTWASAIVEDPGRLDRLADVDDEVLWETRLSRKELLGRFVRGRLRAQAARYGASPDDLRAIETLLPPDRLTLGFARRFAAYKRATLMFQDPRRLAAMLTDRERPVQVVFAGKAHPADQDGQALIRRIVELSRTPELRGHVVVLENYDARMARFLVQGVDVWVNAPRPPMEASGTSGMKAAVNGVVNCSVLDGWWVEGYGDGNGWTFGSLDGTGDYAADDARDAAELYDVLEREIVPLYYDRGPDGVPAGWVATMRRAMATSLHAFSAHRMVAEYVEEVYDAAAVPTPAA